jgi:phosphoribosyl 1,2-cyclic phosphate phosphodiesterase
MKITLLGTGTSGGVPRLDGFWGACDPNNPKNRRRRVSVLVQEQGYNILIDTSPDLREQMIEARIEKLDAVFWTHDHADHCHGIDDLRGFYHAHGAQRIAGYADARTLEVLKQRFDYVFAGRSGYPATVEAHVIEGCINIGPLTIHAFELIHGAQKTLGYRIGGFAYATDFNAIPETAAPYLENLELWVVDALRREPHPTHPHLAQTLGLIERFKPKHAILTHMDWSMDYATLCQELPLGVEPGYDGMTVFI